VSGRGWGRGWGWGWGWGCCAWRLGWLLLCCGALMVHAACWHWICRRHILLGTQAMARYSAC
jgi:hypothetical protein